MERNLVANSPRRCVTGGGKGLMSHSEILEDRDWSDATREATFLPYGKRDKEWDWSYMTPYFTPEPIIT